MKYFPYLFVVFLFFSCTDKTKSDPERPNIVFILADDLGYHDLSCMGSEYYETPNIDQIAKDGITFTNGYAACQVCSPSRASIMTGKFPARHGITDWLGAKTGEAWRDAKRYSQLLPPDYVPHLPHEDLSLAEAFKENGYKTFFAGKWHLGNEGSYPEDHGFDINQGGYERGGPYSGGYFSPFNNPKMEDFPEETGMSLSVKLANETAEFIQNNKSEPFLAYLSFYAVHGPIQTSEEKWNHFRNKADERGIASNGFKMERRLPIRLYQDNPIYAGLIEQMDEGVGIVLEALKKLGLSENTIVIFTSDNGGVASGDNFSTSNSPLRGGKGYQWEGGLRIPYLIKVPWLEGKGSKNETPVNGTDFYPTLLDLANLPLKPDQHQDGISLVPTLNQSAMPERSLVWHYPHYGNQGGDPSAVLRRGDWKLIHYFETGKNELYNLKSDLKETKDLAGQNKDKTDDLFNQLTNYLDEVGASRPVQDPLFNQDSFNLKQQYYQNQLKSRLESQRLEYYKKDWTPNKDWWGSE